MSGILRRFRRRKSADEDEEALDRPPGDAPADPDIYPHRGPEHEGDPDIVAEPAASEEPPTISGSDVGNSPAPPSPEPAIAPHGPTPPASSSSPPEEVRSQVPEVRPELAPGPTAAPPPLPAIDEDAGRAAHRPLTAPSRCFLCGAEMAGSFCPTCRMTWNE